MDRKAYIESVLSALRHVTRREREAIRAEIDGHIEDHMADLLELDYPPELAEERTLAAMGDPQEVGRELNKQYTGWGWVILSRVLLVALAAVCAVVSCSNPSLYGLKQNLEARKPLEWRLEEMGPGGQILDIRVPMGDDIWYIYAAEAKLDPEGNPEVSVWMSWYDRNPFRSAGAGTVTAVDCRGELQEAFGGGGSEAGGVIEYRYFFPVQDGDPYVTVCCERYGEVFQAQVPIHWEVVI